MARRFKTHFLLSIIFLVNKTCALNFTVTDEKIYIKSHIKDPKIQVLCEKRNNVCRSNKTNLNVCVLRTINNTKQYKNFDNSCFLFMSNMCDNPGKEFYILSTGTCEDYLAVRRNDEKSAETTEKPDSEENEETTTIAVTKESLLRNNVATTPPPVLVDEAYDGHPCPHSCVHIYSPVCINVNRGHGKYFKMFTFVNHCMADLYYCRYPDEFLPPPDEDPDELIVSSSPLAWSFCGASRYLQFARFAEVTSSMGHYGWLSGNYPFSHIMEPHERLPNHG